MKTCQHTDRTLYVTPGGLTCYECTPPAYRARYPRWEQIEKERQRKSEQARKNFGIGENHGN